MYFVNTMAAVVMGLAVTSCSDDDLFTEQDALKNANKVLGVEIAANHDWKMSSAVSTAITINLDYDETYDITVYSNDPLTNEYGTVLTQGTVKSGETFVRSFEYPKALTSLFVGVRDSHGHTFYRTAPVADGKLSMTVGTPAVASARGMFKSSTAPAVPDITIPDAAYASSFLNGAKEPNAQNVVDDYDNSYYVDGTPATEGHWVDGTNWGWIWDGTGSTLNYNYAQAAQQGVSQEDITFWDTYCAPYNQQNWSFYGANNQNDAATKLIVEYLRGTGRGSWANVWAEGSAGHYEGGSAATEGHWVYDETYVTKFKVEGSYTGNIDVFGRRPTSMYVSGTWTLANGANEWNVLGQTANAGSVIVVASGGTLVIPKYAKLDLANEARLVVMPGGTVTGEGEIAVHNGNAEGLEGYNGGTIDVATFDNNYGKFYNYGTFKCTNLKGGAGQSNFYNHGVAHIVRSRVANANGGNYDTPNTRIFNACQFYCEEDMRAYIIEMTSGSYFKVGGELMMSTGNDGTNDDTYVALAAGAMMEVGSLYNNLTSWIGPTDGYAVLQAGGISYLNWDGNEPITKGYFINNIAVSVDDTTIGADPNGGNQGKAKGIDTYKAMRDCILNGYGSDVNNYGSAGKTASPNGNGGAVLVNKGCANMSVPADEGFTLGVAGCTPGYNPGTPPRKKVKAQIWSYAFEDSRRCDYDMNDVVLKVSYYQPDEYTIDSTKVDVTLCCTGASYSLTVWLNQNQILGQMEVHRALAGTAGKFINTGHDLSNDKFQQKAAVTIPLIKPQGFNIASADFWIKSPEGEVHVAKTSQDPHGVIIPGDWRWPLEWTCIKDAYPDFVEFAKDPSNPAYAGWYNNPATDKLY